MLKIRGNQDSKAGTAEISSQKLRNFHSTSSEDGVNFN